MARDHWFCVKLDLASLFLLGLFLIVLLWDVMNYWVKDKYTGLTYLEIIVDKKNMCLSVRMYVWECTRTFACTCVCESIYLSFCRNWFAHYIISWWHRGFTVLLEITCMHSGTMLDYGLHLNSPKTHLTKVMFNVSFFLEKS